MITWTRARTAPPRSITRQRLPIAGFSEPLRVEVEVSSLSAYDLHRRRVPITRSVANSKKPSMLENVWAS